MVPCSGCGCHVFSHACRCEHCGVKLRSCRTVAKTAAAALLGLALAEGCAESIIAPPQPAYGVADMDVDVDTDSDVDTDTDTAGDTGDTSGDTDDTDSGQDTADSTTDTAPPS